MKQEFLSTKLLSSTARLVIEKKCRGKTSQMMILLSLCAFFKRSVSHLKIGVQ